MHVLGDGLESRYLGGERNSFNSAEEASSHAAGDGRGLIRAEPDIAVRRPCSIRRAGYRTRLQKLGRARE